MKSNLVLTFKDNQDKENFVKARNPEIIMISGILLLQRFIFFITVLVNFLVDSTETSAERTYLNSIGLGIHLVMIGTLFIDKHLYFWQIIHCPIIMLSYMTFLGNSI